MSVDLWYINRGRDARTSGPTAEESEAPMRHDRIGRAQRATSGRAHQPTDEPVDA